MYMTSNKTVEVSKSFKADRKILAKLIDPENLMIPQACEDCTYRSNECAAGVAANIVTDAEAYTQDQRLFIGQEVTQLFREAMVLPELVRVAYMCVDRIDSGGGLQDFDFEQIIEQSRLRNSDI